jgi:hypothetical protein
MYRLQVIYPDIYILGQTTNSTGSRSNTWILHVAGSDPRSSTACRSSLKRVRGCGLEPGAPQPAGQTQRSTGCRSDPRRSTGCRSDSELYRLQVRSQEVHRLQVRLRTPQAAGQIPGGSQTTGQTQSSTDCRSYPRRSIDYRSDSELNRLQVRSQEVH